MKCFFFFSLSFGELHKLVQKWTKESLSPEKVSSPHQNWADAEATFLSLPSLLSSPSRRCKIFLLLCELTD